VGPPREAALASKLAGALVNTARRRYDMSYRYWGGNMPNYSGIQKEETLKGHVSDDYFSKFGYEPNIDNIDFVITGKKIRDPLFGEGPGSSVHYLWAEAKKGTSDVFDMFTQLILTCKKTYEKAEHLAPPWLGCFDEARIAFVSFHDMLPIFIETDFNWNTMPSNHEAADFQKAREKVKNLIGAKIALYHFETDDEDIKDFIKTHFVIGGAVSIKAPITKDNFVQIFIKWVKEVKPFIDISKEEWADFRKAGVLDCDFYRADVMSKDGTTITQKLKIILENDNYKLHENISGRLFAADIRFKDKGEAYTRFWNKYERPPAPVFQRFIIDRRDLLVPQNIREVKGSFFTPKIWADKSKEYLAAVLGDNWQDEYYIWDCAAGTGNLLAGLTNPYNIWASDIEQGNIDTMQSLIDIDENLNLLPGHVFQFDFLNDYLELSPTNEMHMEKMRRDMAKLEAAGLKKILDDPEKRKKLIIYINPPYAESGAGIGKGTNKKGVAAQHRSHDFFLPSLGKASHELFAQFMARINHFLPRSHLALFATLKYLNSYNFRQFRDYFQAEFKGGFICRANTFDNVKGEFPIGFIVWQLSGKPFPAEIQLDVFHNDGSPAGAKKFSNGQKYINEWFRRSGNIPGDVIGVLHSKGIDFQNNQGVWICINRIRGGGSHFVITKGNLIVVCVYFAVRNILKHTWINHNDQFLYPNNGWEIDMEFQHNCLMYALFCDKNRIQSQEDTNHWIPFTEKEVQAKEKFDSDFMSNFLAGKAFSPEAQAVLAAGLKLWQYYHTNIKGSRTASVNASLYDIREFFQGRNDKGTMNAASTDETYNALLAGLRGNLRALTERIQPKVYEYGFLKE
jgi:hypothetical protein